MAKVIRLRASPHLIRLGGGLTYGSGAFYGQTAHNLTNTLRDLQDIESLRKFAQGEPEIYLAYWKIRQKTAKGPLKDKMALYADQATKRIESNEADSKALTAYAKTNNHQAYMDYLLGKLDQETDPAQAAKLATQIDTLRSRIFKAGAGGSLAGGVSSGELANARVAYEDAVQKAYSLINSRGGISQNDPSAPMDIKRLTEITKNLQGLNEKIVADTGAPAKARLDASAEINSGAKGTANVVYEVQKASDTRQMSDSGFDAKGNTNFNAKVSATTDPAAKAKLLADRASKASALASGIQTEDLKKDLTDASQTYQTEAAKNIITVNTVVSKMPAEAEAKLFQAWSDYKTDMAKYGQAGSDVPYNTFKTEIKAANDPATLMKNLKMTPQMQQEAPFTEEDLAKLQDYFANGDPAQYDSTTGTWTGDPTKTAQARAADEAARTLLSIKGSIYDPYKIKDAGQMSPSERSDLLFGVSRGTALDMGVRAQAAQTDLGGGPGTTPREAGAGANASTQAAPLPPLNPLGSTEEKPTAPPMAETAPSGGIGKPLNQLTDQKIEPGSTEDLNSAIGSVDEFLMTKDLAELPDWASADQGQADFNGSFPYSLPGVSTPDLPQQTHKGQAY